MQFTEVTPWTNLRYLSPHYEEYTNGTTSFEQYYGNYDQQLDKSFYHDRSLNHNRNRSENYFTYNRGSNRHDSNRFVNYSEPKYYLGKYFSLNSLLEIYKLLLFPNFNFT